MRYIWQILSKSPTSTLFPKPQQNSTSNQISLTNFHQLFKKQRKVKQKISPKSMKTENLLTRQNFIHFLNIFTNIVDPFNN